MLSDVLLQDVGQYLQRCAVLKNLIKCRSMKHLLSTISSINVIILSLLLILLPVEYKAVPVAIEASLGSHYSVSEGFGVR